jgi:hypothetical protein
VADLFSGDEKGDSQQIEPAERQLKGQNAHSDGVPGRMGFASVPLDGPDSAIYTNSPESYSADGSVGISMTGPNITDPQPITTILWSKALVEALGEKLPRTHGQLVGELDEILKFARDWFVHAIPIEGTATDDGDVCAMFNGDQGENGWRVHGQLAIYRDLPEAPAREGQPVKFPRPIEVDDNHIFAETSALLG